MVHIPLTLVGMGKIREIGALVKELGGQRCLIMTDSDIVRAGLVDPIRSSLETAGCDFDLFDRCKAHAPSGVIKECSELVKQRKYDLLIGVGGGSVMDTVKAVSVLSANELKLSDLIHDRTMMKPLRKVLVPTTAGTGSEWSRTGVYYDEEEDEERLVIDTPLFADRVIIDPELTLTLPPRVTADSGMDALTHAIEAYTSATTNAVADVFARSAIQLISNHLRRAYLKGKEDQEARYHMSIAACMAMSAVAMNGAGLAHFLNPQIVKRTHLPHGEACTLMLPHAMAFNLVARKERLAAIAEWMGEDVKGCSMSVAAKRAVEAVQKMSRDLHMPQRLSEIGIEEEDLPPMADATMIHFRARIEAKIPLRVTRDDILRIYEGAL